MHCRAVDTCRVTLMGASSADFDIGLKEALEKDIVAPMLVDERRIRLERLAHVINGGQFFEIEGNGGRDVLGLGSRRRHAHGNQLTDLSHLVRRKNRLIRNLEARQRCYCADRLDADQVGGSEYHMAITFGDLNGFDARMSEGAANEGHILQSRHSDIADELTAPAHKPVVLFARHARTYTLP